ncbi:MAG TPA: GUN4 domain-containing protein [Leptolyngbyaceae cyanobacterium]
MTQTPDPSEKPAPSKRQFSGASSEQRWLQHSVQSIVRWSPLGGSAWAFGSFLLQQQWAMAALLFPVTAVSGVWAAYSKNFVERLTEIYGERARSDADALVKFLDSLNEALKWQFSGFDAKYLKLQAKPCQEYLTEGFNPDKTAIPMLEQVFVPLELSGYLALEKTLESAESASDSLSIWDLIRRSRKNKTFRQMAIQAQGGFGKTTLMRHIALIYGEGKHRRYQAPKLIPFLLYLRDWRKLLAQDALPTLPDLITQHYLPMLLPSQPLQPPPKWADSLLRHGEALVMFDGFDELAEGERQHVSHWLSAQMREYSESTFILTSRPSGYKDYVAKPPTAPLFVRRFNPQQQQDFVERWYLCQERCARSEKQAQQAKDAAERRSQNLLQQLVKRPELQEMAQNPLLLNMLATYHRFEPGTQLPQRRIELYQRICKLQLDDRPIARGIAMLLPFEKSHQVLQNLALTMVKHNNPKVSHSQLIAFLQKHPLLKQEDVSPAAFLKQMVQVSELLVEREPGEYEFPHLSFQGYFAAACLEQQREAGVKQILENWQQSWWRETILLYTAQLGPKQLANVIHKASQLGPQAAQLVYDCLREYRNLNKLNPALVQELGALRYQQLETYLKQGEWQEADQETYRLMITTVGKEEGQLFDPDDLQNFPCEELRTIDGLWVKYSNGKFGFSVQKQIYVETGNPLDGKYHKETWEKFCDRIGWMRKGKYVSSTYSTVAPTAHLPGRRMVPIARDEDMESTRFLVASGFLLFSRAQTCRL